MPFSATLFSVWTLFLPPTPSHLPSVSQASFGVGDSLLIVVVALIVFGPKKLPEISRQVGKLLYEFRKASNDFKFQIEEELRSAEQAERQKQLQAQAATPQPATPVAITAGETVSAEPSTAEAVRAEIPTEVATQAEVAIPETSVPSAPDASAAASATSPETGPTILPPSTGLPVGSRPPNRVTDTAEDSAAVPTAAESLDEMQANAQDAVRAAAADPSYNLSDDAAVNQPVPTHHG